MSQSHAVRDAAYADVLREIRDGLLTVTEIAAIVGVKERQVHHWGAGGYRPQPGARDALLELRYLVKMLLEIYRPEGVEIWLHSRNPELDDQRPMDLLRQRRFEPVLQAVHRLGDGAA